MAYAKLKGRIRECGLTQKQLAAIVGINPATLSIKLRSRGDFNKSEMNAICKALNIAKENIGEYFFADSVQKN